MQFHKYHGIGNDYIVLTANTMADQLPAKSIQRICHRNIGVGSDGILVGPMKSKGCDFRLRIFNPDGSEAEKSGNGLRIFARFLFDQGLVNYEKFTVETLGGPVSCRVHQKSLDITVQMGEVSFDSEIIPVTGPKREVINEQMTIRGRVLDYCAATVGNPHCVIINQRPSPGIASEFGPLIEQNPRFPNRTNVQFLEVIDRGNIKIEIWERGTGYTLASGSSSTAASAVALRLGLCDKNITVSMPGGKIEIIFTDGFHATMTGPVSKICDGKMAAAMFSDLNGQLP